jgi:hypothetical protein
MYVFSIKIPFKGIQSLAKMSKVTAVSYLNSGINDSAEIFSKFAYLHSGVNDSAVYVIKIGDYKVDFLGEYKSILKKALTRVSGAWSCLMKKPEVKNLVSGSPN